MRRRVIAARISWILLALLLGIDLGARGFVLCVAANDHVAVEDTRAFSRCHGSESSGSATEARALAHLDDFASSCRDSVLLEPTLQLRSAADLKPVFKPLAGSAIVASPLPGLLRVTRSLERRSGFTPDAPARLLRSVILLV